MNKTQLKKIIVTLKDSNCFDKASGRLVIYPQSLTFETLKQLEAKGFLTRKFYGSATYGHEDYFLANIPAEPVLQDFAVHTLNTKAQGRKPYIIHASTEAQIKRDFKRHGWTAPHEIYPVTFNPATGDYDRKEM